jgi:hypothetical protein
MPNKTVPTSASVTAYIANLAGDVRQQECRTLVRLFQKACGQKPVMWGDRIIGFGRHRYPLANGKTGEICKASFAPRSKSFALYLADFPGRPALLTRLGRHRFQGGYLHLPSLAEVDLEVLTALVRQAYLHNLQGEQY